MAYTLFDLTLGVARLLKTVREGKATAAGDAGKTTLVDSGRDEADDFWNGSGTSRGTIWITYDAGGANAAPQGEYSIVTDFANATGTITFDALTAATAAGDRYAVGKPRYPLDILIQNVNLVLQDFGEIPVVDTTSVTIAASQTEYTLPTAMWPDKLLQVCLQLNNSDSDDNEWTLPLHNCYVQSTTTGTANTLVLPKQYDTGYALKLVYLANHPELRIYSDKLSEFVPFERVIYEAAVLCLERKSTNEAESILLTHYKPKVEELKLSKPIAIPQKTGRGMMISQNRGDLIQTRYGEIYVP